MSRCSTSPISARRSRRLSPINTTLDDNDDRDSVKSEPLSPLPADPPAEENLLGGSIDKPITWPYHDIEDDGEPANSGRYGLSSRAKDPSVRYRQPRPLRKMEAFHCQELWQECIDYHTSPDRSDFSGALNPARCMELWQKKRNLLGDRTVTWVQVVGTPDNGPCACCTKNGSICAVPLKNKNIPQIQVSCVIRRQVCDLYIRQPRPTSRKRPIELVQTADRSSPARRSRRHLTPDMHATPSTLSRFATSPMSTDSTPFNPRFASISAPPLGSPPHDASGEAEKTRKRLDRFLDWAADMFGHDKERPANGEPIPDVNLAYDIGDAKRRMKELEQDPANGELARETYTWAETAVDSVEKYVAGMPAKQGHSQQRTVSRYQEAKADLVSWKRAAGM